MSLTGSMRVLYPLLISSIFLEVAIGSACQDAQSNTWSAYCKKLNPRRRECLIDYSDRNVRKYCPESCGLCITTTIPPPLPTTATTKVPSTTKEATTITQPSTAVTTVASTAATTDLIIRPTTASTTGELQPDNTCDRDSHFGRSCRFKCNCRNGEMCDKVTGRCLGGECAGEFWGDHCLLNSSCSYNDMVNCSVGNNNTTCTGGFYQGKLNTTASNKNCLHWFLFMSYSNEKFIDGSRNNATNYCRNPGKTDSTKPWCYTVNRPFPQSNEWKHCNINVCACPKYRFGRNCEHECLCYDVDEVCDGTTGACPRSGHCWKGVTGSECKTDCEDGKFGINCEYTCHCKDSVCDKKTGACSSGCDLGWSGEACQIGNAAFQKNTTQSITSIEKDISVKAVDDKAGGCLTLDKNNENMPWWWRVDLEHRHVLFNLTIRIKNCLQCTGNISLKNVDNFRSTLPGNICNSFHANNEPVNRHEVECVKPVIGRYLFIELEYSDGPIKLCDVKIQAYQYKDCPYTEYGPNCNLKCQCENATEKCDVITGNCPVSGCKRPHSGKDCQTTFSTPATTTLSTTTTTIATTISTTSNTTPVPTTATTETFSTPATPTLSTTTTTIATTIPTTSTTTPVPTTVTTVFTTSTTSRRPPTPVETTSTEATTTTEPTSTSTTTEVQESSSTTQVLTTTARTTVLPTEVTPSPSPPAVTQYTYPWTWTDIHDGWKKEKGSHCVIPFKYRDKEYHDCTSGAENRQWCPYVYVYVDESGDSWGYCPACRGVKPSPPLNITTTSRPAGLGKQAIVNVTWEANLSNEECKYSIKYNVKFAAIDDQKKYFVTALEELHSEWLDAPANQLIHVSVQSINCFNLPCKLSEWSGSISMESSNKYPGPVKNMHVTQSTPTSLTLKWEPNEDDQGVFDYKVNQNETRFSNGNHSAVTLRDLKPGSKYQISVTPRNKVGYGESASIEAWTDIEDPTPPKPPKLMKNLTTPYSISVHISPATPPNSARIIGYILKLKVANACLRKQEKNDGGCCIVNEDSDVNSSKPITEVPPAGKKVELNVKSDMKYMICYGVKVRGKHGDPKIKYAEMEDIIDVPQLMAASNSREDNSSELYIFVGVGLAAFLLLISTVVALIAVIVRKKNITRVAVDPEVELTPRCHSDFFDHLSRHSGQNQVLALLGHHIVLEEFLTCVRQMKQNGGVIFTEEFQLICRGQGSYPTEVAKANMTKNRYKNILPYDHSRVVLQRDDPDESDFINANFLMDREGEVAYIATQGPKPTTVADFWLMIWQQEVVEIVMLAKVVEDDRPKCYKYWPDVSEADSYNFDLTVTCQEEIDMQGFTIRRLQAQRGDDVRQIQQVHYTAWPDHGVPTETHSLLAMMKHVGQVKVDAPMLVHCSAGVGRTGTFIAIREMMKQGQAEGSIDIMKFVLQLRQKRPSMVQTKNQYLFIYTTIGEYLQQEKTAIDPYKLHQHYKELQKPRVADDGFTTTGMDEEFEVLQSMTNDIPKVKQGNALSGANKEKNRHPGVLPNIDHAVKLIDPGQDSDYINAVYVDGYMLQRAFIVTQIPMANTRDDFWNMVNERGASVLVQMTDDPDLKQNGSSYLPTNEEDVLVGTLRVKLQSVQSTSPPMDEIICRKLVCGHPTQKNTVDITHYSFATYPPSPVAISVILGELDKESQYMSKGPVVSLCQDGAGWSGVLCACHHICKQMQLEETVNVFQCVHRIRNSRPELVWTKEQYDFCYSVALTFLDSFVVYENLKY